MVPFYRTLSQPSPYHTIPTPSPSVLTYIILILILVLILILILIICRSMGARRLHERLQEIRRSAEPQRRPRRARRKSDSCSVDQWRCSRTYHHAMDALKAPTFSSMTFITAVLHCTVSWTSTANLTSSSHSIPLTVLPFAHRPMMLT